MKLSDIAPAFQIVNVLVGIVYGAIGLAIGLQTFNRGQIPEKHLLANEPMAINALSDLEQSGQAISVSVTGTTIF